MIVNAKKLSDIQTEAEKLATVERQNRIQIDADRLSAILFQDDIKSLTNISKRLYVAVWLRPEAVNMRPLWVSVDDMSKPEYSRYSIARKDDPPVVKEKTDQRILRADIA